MKKIVQAGRQKIPTQTRINIKKTNATRLIPKESKLERSPNKTYFDYSTEEKGYFTRRDKNGNVLEVINLIFPR